MLYNNNHNNNNNHSFFTQNSVSVIPNNGDSFLSDEMKEITKKLRRAYQTVDNKSDMSPKKNKKLNSRF